MLKQIGFLLLLMNAQLLFAQNPEVDTLQKYFRDYQLHSPQEKLFIHTDKTFYLAGETIWFKVYVVDAAFNRPMDVSSISYVEVLSQDLKSVLQVKISLDGGFGNGFLILPGFLHSGNYILRGYTNWMKNFSPEFYFEQPITIVNTLRRLTIGAPAERLPSIQFLPEGGNLLAGFSSRVAFKAVDSNGTGLNCQGVIVNQRNDTIVAFGASHLGMGSFQFKPEKNTDYFAIIHFGGQLIRQKLPMALDRGYLMDLQPADSGIIKIRVRATPEFDLTTVYFFAQTRQLVKSVQMSELHNGETNFILDKKILGDGISTLTIFDARRQPVCERLVFKRPEKELDISAIADQQVYDQRSVVHIDLLSRANGHTVPANLSASVFMMDALQKIPEKDIVSYLWLASDLHGNIESPDYYFRNDDKAVNEALDILLLTQGWRRFNWTDILSGKKPAFEFLPELEGPVVNGKVVDKKTGAPIIDADAFISIPGDSYAFNIASSDGQGTVRFSIKDIYKNNVVVMQPALRKDSAYRVNITNAWSEKFSSARIPTLSLSKNQQKELISRSVDNQIENSFVTERKYVYPEARQDSGSFYGRPDKVYYLDNYIRYQTMEEVLREYVFDVRVRKEGEKFSLKVKNGETDLYFEGFPLIMLDGIPVEDATDIIGVDPLKIKKIELVPRKYYIGSFVFEGIINVKSYTNDAGATLIDPNATVVEFEGIQVQREFYSPVYNTEAERESRVPDSRNVLYWAPQVSTGKDGKYRLSFFTSDVKGRFLVLVQGITPDGLPGKSMVQFEVK